MELFFVVDGGSPAEQGASTLRILPARAPFVRWFRGGSFCYCWYLYECCPSRPESSFASFADIEFPQSFESVRETSPLTCARRACAPCENMSIRFHGRRWKLESTIRWLRIRVVYVVVRSKSFQVVPSIVAIIRSVIAAVSVKKAMEIRRGIC